MSRKLPASSKIKRSYGNSGVKRMVSRTWSWQVWAPILTYCESVVWPWVNNLVSPEPVLLPLKWEGSIKSKILLWVSSLNSIHELTGLRYSNVCLRRTRLWSARQCRNFCVLTLQRHHQALSTWHLLCLPGRCFLYFCLFTKVRHIQRERKAKGRNNPIQSTLPPKILIVKLCFISSRSVFSISKRDSAFTQIISKFFSFVAPAFHLILKTTYFPCVGSTQQVIIGTENKVHAWYGWVVCSGSHEAETRCWLSCVPLWRLWVWSDFQAQTVGWIQFLATVRLPCLFPCLAAKGCSQRQKATSIPHHLSPHL